MLAVIFEFAYYEFLYYSISVHCLCFNEKDDGPTKEKIADRDIMQS